MSVYPSANLYSSWQFTAESAKELEAWFMRLDLQVPYGATQELEAEKGCTPERCNKGSWKASVPPFNIKKGVEPPTDCEQLNVPTFGVKSSRSIMKLFESEKMKQLSRELGLPIPEYSLDTFVVKKITKVFDLVKEARKPEHSLDDQDLQAVAGIERFCEAFAKLDAKQLSGPEDFRAFVEKHVEAGWEDNLHFDHVLVKIFGLSERASTLLRQTTIKVMDKDKEEEVTLEHHALRWLSKAFKGYGPVGCLTDVVNLAYAMLEEPSEASEQDVIAAISKFESILDAGAFDRLWIPTHLAHDAESDDTLVWLLLEHIHRVLGSSLQVLIQLPADEQFNEVEAYLKDKHAANVQVFRDADSGNAKAVGNVWRPVVAKAKAAETRAAKDEKPKLEDTSPKSLAKPTLIRAHSDGEAVKGTRKTIPRQDAEGHYHVRDLVCMHDDGKEQRNGVVTGFDVAYKADGRDARGYVFDELRKLASDADGPYCIGELVRMRDSDMKWRQGYITAVKVAYKCDYDKSDKAQGYYFDHVQKVEDSPTRCPSRASFFEDLDGEQ